MCKSPQHWWKVDPWRKNQIKANPQNIEGCLGCLFNILVRLQKSSKRAENTDPSRSLASVNPWIFPYSKYQRHGEKLWLSASWSPDKTGSILLCGDDAGMLFFPTKSRKMVACAAKITQRGDNSWWLSPKTKACARSRRGQRNVDAPTNRNFFFLCVCVSNWLSFKTRAWRKISARLIIFN